MRGLEQRVRNEMEGVYSCSQCSWHPLCAPVVSLLRSGIPGVVSESSKYDWNDPGG